MWSEEISEFEEELAKYRTAPKAQIIKGREGNVIGIISENINDVNEGMIVLFSSKPPAMMTVRLIDYQVRESKKTSGKYYVKCFRWLEESVFQKTIEELEQKIKKFRDKENIERLKEILSDPETALKLLDTKQAEALASLLIKEGARAVFWNSDQEFLIVNEELKMLRFNDVLEISVVQSPVQFEPEQWKTEEFEIVKIPDEISEIQHTFIAIVSSWNQILLIPKDQKEIAEKLRRISKARIPEETKMQLYKALLEGDQK